MPGPAAYGRGGTAATTTDANLALGRINPDYFCGGAVDADMPAVSRALQEVADALGVSPLEAARGIVRIANHNMINALKLVSVNRGHDPRDFTMIAFGGGGGMHAVALATELGMRRVVIPFAADVFSAWGMLMSDLRRDYFVTRLARFAPASAPVIDALLTEVIGDAISQFEGEGIPGDQVKFVTYAKLRYENQEHSVELQLPDGSIGADAITAAQERFHAAYEREYTYRLDAPVEFVGVHVVAVAEVGKLAPAPLPAADLTLAAARKGTRAVDYTTEGLHQADIYTGELLGPGMKFTGPAVVETKGSTIVIHPGNEVTIDPYGNLIIEIAGAEVQVA
jgi:N-methylhydantoinase A